MELVDTHCHLQFDKFSGRVDEIIADAQKEGVKRFICPGTSLEDSLSAAAIARSRPEVWAAAGVHPHEAEKFMKDPAAAGKLKEIAGLPKVAAIGETGLDYYRLLSSKESQQAVLRTHLETGIELGLPLIFHIRDAWEDFWKIFDDYQLPGQRTAGVVHSFSSGRDNLDQVLSRGLYAGLNGIMTFTKDPSQLEAARAVPRDKLLIETDAPFLAPAPFRTELCAPKHAAVTAEFLADLRGESSAELADAATRNAVKLFSLDEGV